MKDQIHLVVVDTSLDYQCQLYTSFNFPIRYLHDFDSVSSNLDILQVNLKLHLSRVSITSVWFGKSLVDSSPCLVCETE